MFDHAEGETTRRVIHKHWFVFLKMLLGHAILFIIPTIVITVVIASFSSNGVPIQASGALTLFGISVWGLIIWMKLFGAWTDYYLDSWIITNRRIIDIDQQGFFKRNVATLMTFEKVEDVTTNVSGLFETVLDFGDVKVQTAAANTEFIIHDVGNPRGVQKLIRALRDEAHASRPH